MEDPRMQRRKKLKSLFGNPRLGRMLSAPENKLNKKDREALRKCLSHSNDVKISEIKPWDPRSEQTSSQPSSSRKSWKASVGRSLSSIRWNFLSSLTNYKPCYTASVKNSCASFLICKHETSLSSSSSSSFREIQEEKSDFAFSDKEFKGIKEPENFLAGGANCHSQAADCEDEKKYAGWEQSSGTENLVCGGANHPLQATDCEDEKENALFEQISQKETEVEQEEADCSEEEEECGGDDKVEENGEEDTVENYEEEKEGFQGGERHVGHKKKEARSFPPPLPSLARTGNLPCHMPWVHLRSYKTDGRLVIQKVKLRHHEFFQAKRSNGRLTLQLVQHDEGKIRAHQAEMARGSAIDPISVQEDVVNHCEENDDEDIGADVSVNENLDEGDPLPDEDRDKDVAATEEIKSDKDVAATEEKKCDKDVAGTEGKNGGDAERPSISGRPDKILPSFSFRERDPRLPDRVQAQIQRFSGSPLRSNSGSSPIGFGSLGLDSPVGCCSPKPNPLFERPISAIRPILS